MGRKMEKLQRVFMPTSSRTHKRDGNQSNQPEDPSTTGLKSTGPGNRIIGTSSDANNVNPQQGTSSSLAPPGAKGTTNDAGSYAPSTASMKSGHIGKAQGKSPLSGTPASNSSPADSAAAGTSSANATSRDHYPQGETQEAPATTGQDMMQSGPPVRDLPGSSMAALAPGPTEPVGFDNAANTTGSDSHLARDGAAFAGVGAVAAGGAVIAADRHKDAAVDARDLPADRQDVVGSSVDRPGQGGVDTNSNSYASGGSERSNPYSSKALDPRVEGALGGNQLEQAGCAIGRKPVPQPVSTENRTAEPVDSLGMTEKSQGHSAGTAGVLAVGGIGAGSLGVAAATHGHEDRDARGLDTSTAEQTGAGYQPSAMQESSAGQQLSTAQQLPTAQDSSATQQTFTGQSQFTERPRYADRNPSVIDQSIPGAFPMETPLEERYRNQPYAPGTAVTTNEVTGSSARSIHEPGSTVQDIPESGPRVMGIPAPQSPGMPEPQHAAQDTSSPEPAIRNISEPTSTVQGISQPTSTAQAIPEQNSAAVGGIYKPEPTAQEVSRPQSPTRDTQVPESTVQDVPTPLIPLTAGAAAIGTGGQSEVSPYSSNWPALGNEQAQKGPENENQDLESDNAPAHDSRNTTIGLGAVGLGAVGLGGAAAAHNVGRQDEAIPSQGLTSQSVARKPSKLEKEGKRHSRSMSTDEGKEKKGLFHRLTHRRRRSSAVGPEDNSQSKAAAHEPQLASSRAPAVAAVPVAAATRDDAIPDPPGPKTQPQDTTAAPVAISDRTASRGYGEQLPEGTTAGQDEKPQGQDKALQDEKEKDHHYGTAAGVGAAGVGAGYLTSKAVRNAKDSELDREVISRESPTSGPRESEVYAPTNNGSAFDGSSREPSRYGTGNMAYDYAGTEGQAVDHSTGVGYGAATGGVLGVPAALDASRKEVSPGATSSLYSQQQSGQPLALGSDARTGDVQPGYESAAGYGQGPQALGTHTLGTGDGFESREVGSSGAYPPESEPAIRRADPRFIAAGFTDPDFPRSQAQQAGQNPDGEIGGYAQGAHVDSRTAPHLTQQQIHELELGQQGSQYEAQQMPGYYDPAHSGQQQTGYDTQDQSNARYAAAGAAGAGVIGTGTAMGHAGNYTPPKSPNDGSFPRDVSKDAYARDVGYNPTGTYGQMRAPDSPGMYDSPAVQAVGRGGGPGGRGWTPGVDDLSRENSGSGSSGVEHKGRVAMHRGEKGRMRLHKEPKKGHQVGV